MQTRFGLPDGNCLTACIASILELDLGDLPSFMHHEDWILAVNRWLSDIGQPFSILCVRFADNAEPKGYLALAWIIASGPSPRGIDHSVVWRNGAMVHDPHPDGSGITRVNDYCVFIAHDPAQKAFVRSWTKEHSKAENRNLDDLCRYLLRGNVALAQCLAERLVIDRAVSCDYAEARKLIKRSEEVKAR